jgi:hypothetical protein
VTPPGIEPAVLQPTTLPRAADIHAACYKYYANIGTTTAYVLLFSVVGNKTAWPTRVCGETAIASFVSGAQMMYGLTPWEMCSFLRTFFIWNNELAVLRNVSYFLV